MYTKLNQNDISKKYYDDYQECVQNISVLFQKSIAPSDLDKFCEKSVHTQHMKLNEIETRINKQEIKLYLTKNDNKENKNMNYLCNSTNDLQTKRKRPITEDFELSVCKIKTFINNFLSADDDLSTTTTSTNYSDKLECLFDQETWKNSDNSIKVLNNENKCAAIVNNEQIQILNESVSKGNNQIDNSITEQAITMNSTNKMYQTAKTIQDKDDQYNCLQINYKDSIPNECTDKIFINNESNSETTDIAKTKLKDLQKTENCQKERLIKLNQESNCFTMKDEMISLNTSQGGNSSKTYQKKKYKSYIMPIRTNVTEKTNDVWKNDLCPRRTIPKMVPVNIDTSGFKFIKRIYKKKSSVSTNPSSSCTTEQSPSSSGTIEQIRDSSGTTEQQLQQLKSDNQQLPIKVPSKQVSSQSISNLPKLSTDFIPGSEESLFTKYSSPTFQKATINITTEDSNTNSGSKLNIHEIIRGKFFEKLISTHTQTSKDVEKIVASTSTKKENYVFLGFEPRNTTTNEKMKFSMSYNNEETENSDRLTVKEIRKCKNAKKKQEMADLELARKIHLELNRKNKRMSLSLSDPKDWF